MFTRPAKFKIKALQYIFSKGKWKAVDSMSVDLNLDVTGCNEKQMRSMVEDQIKTTLGHNWHVIDVQRN